MLCMSRQLFAWNGNIWSFHKQSPLSIFVCWFVTPREKFEHRSDGGRASVRMSLCSQSSVFSALLHLFHPAPSDILSSFASCLLWVCQSHRAFLTDAYLWKPLQQGPAYLWMGTLGWGTMVADWIPGLLLQSEDGHFLSCHDRHLVIFVCTVCAVLINRKSEERVMARKLQPSLRFT